MKRSGNKSPRGAGAVRNENQRSLTTKQISYSRQLYSFLMFWQMQSLSFTYLIVINGASIRKKDIYVFWPDKSILPLMNL
jgi:hypothetical protein